MLECRGEHTFPGVLIDEEVLLILPEKGIMIRKKSRMQEEIWERIMKIYIIRHGQTEWNKSGRLQGQTDIALNENGRKLAALVGQAIKSIPFDRVISSPLSRSIETAQLVLRENVGKAGELLRAQMGSTQGNKGEGCLGRLEKVIVTDQRIKEISFGEYEGYSIPSTSMFTGDSRFAITDPAFRNFFDAPHEYQPPKGGESMLQLMQRTGDFLEELAKEADEQVKRGEKEELILISTHGAASRALLANIKHTELKDFWYPGVPKNCSVSIAEVVNGSWKMVEQDVIYYTDEQQMT